MTAKRFEIVKSKLIKDGWVISDKLKQFTFPTLKGDKRALVSYCKALNELHEEKEMWKRECKRLKGLYYLENENVELDDIIGLVKTDESTNSVELKKELYK